MRIVLPEAIALLEKFIAERTPVVAAFVSTPCNSSARVSGLVRLESIGEMSLLVIGEDHQAFNQIRFRLGDCTCEYGDFRGEREAEKFAAFLVISSNKGDIMSLFETNH